MHPADHASSGPPRDRALAVIGGLLVVNLVGLALVGLASPPPALGCAFDKAILCAELPPSGAALSALLLSPVNALWQWRLSIWLDMPFLLLYGALLAGSARSLASAPRWLVRAAIVGAIAGAACDVVENIGILVAADAPQAVTDGLAGAISVAARAKFALLGVSCGALAGLALSRRREAPWQVAVIGLGGIIALGGGVVGLGAPRVIELGALGVAIVCLGLWWRALRRAWRRPSRSS